MDPNKPTGQGSLSDGRSRRHSRSDPGRGEFRRKNIKSKYMLKKFQSLKNSKKEDIGFLGFRESPGGPPTPHPKLLNNVDNKDTAQHYHRVW